MNRNTRLMIANKYHDSGNWPPLSVQNATRNGLRLPVRCQANQEQNSAGDRANGHNWDFTACGILGFIIIVHATVALRNLPVTWRATRKWHGDAKREHVTEGHCAM